MDYKVCEATELERLANQVKYFLDKGYKLHGGIGVAVVGHARYYHQVVIKEEY